VAHTPNIILFTPPPVEESIVYEGHKQMNADFGQEGEVVIRKAVDAKAYADADAVKEVGEEERVAVVDVWGAYMEKARWKEGEVLPGTREGSRNEVLAGLLYDGE
jgi:isoamyl acetate esterase